MTNEVKQKFIAAEFGAFSLSNFTENNNTRIKQLTKLAEENIESAPIIVRLIENYLETAEKLCILYLVNSIVKNKSNGSVYNSLFSENIASVFSKVFENARSKSDRISMFQLRKKWSATFSQKTLHKLDVMVKKIDPSWPVVAPPPSHRVSPPPQPSTINVGPLTSSGLPNRLPEENANKALKRKVRTDEDEKPACKKSRKDPSDEVKDVQEINVPNNASLPLPLIQGAKRKMNDAREEAAKKRKADVLPTDCNKIDQYQAADPVPRSHPKNDSFVLGKSSSVQCIQGPFVTGEMKIIRLDNGPREIRFYGDTAVAAGVAAAEDPRTISFQTCVRRVLLDNKTAIDCTVGGEYKSFSLNGQLHQVKIGDAPTRELWIDGNWYQCSFGGPAVTVNIDGRPVNIQLQGPAPQIVIGNDCRSDLLTGRVAMVIDDRVVFPFVYLDLKCQHFLLDEQDFTLQFTDALQTVLVDGFPHQVNFGFGSKFKFKLEDHQEHTAYFSALPRGVEPGHAFQPQRQ